MFREGVLLGLAIAAPVGPIGLLCMARTARQGPAVGLATGLGAASADAAFAGLGVAGMSWMLPALQAWRAPLAWVGCALLLYLGISMLRRPAADTAVADRAGGWWQACFSALLLTLANPMTILSFAAAFTALAGARPQTTLDGAGWVAGVFCGSMLWWWTLAYGGGRYLARLGPQGRRWLDRASGALLIVFALSAGLQVW